jgi:hypothetical protein
METSQFSKYTNKQVKIILNNGKEINSKIVYIDTVENTIDFEDGRSIAISFIKELVNGENKNSTTTNHVVKEITPISPKSEIITKNDFIVEKTLIETLKPDTILVSETQNNSKHIEVLKKLMEIEIGYDTAIKNLQTISLKPEMAAALPKEIKDLENGAKTEQATLWTKIINQYNNAVKNGGLHQNKDALNTIVSNTQLLVKLMPNTNFYELLAYVALENKELYLACWALENVFKEYGGIGKNDKYWYKFVELVVNFSNYKALEHITKTILLSPLEQEKIFKAVCYSLIKLNRKNIVENLIEKTLGSNPDFKYWALDGLKELPKEPLSVYTTFKANLEISPVKIVEKSPVSSYTNNAIKNKPNNNLPPHLQGYVSRGSNAETLKNARIERDITKNLKKAEELFIKGIQNERDVAIKERAVRDLASMLGQQMKEPRRGVEVIHKYQATFSDSDLHLLYSLYFQDGNYIEAIKIQKQILKNTPRKDLRLARYLGLASCYIQLGNFKEAEENYILALKINPSQYAIEKNIALCLYKQGKNEEAKKILNRIIADYGDGKAQELLDTIEGKNQNTDFILDYKNYDNYDASLDKITLFFLEKCNMSYVKDRIENNTYIGSTSDKEKDLKKLEDDAGPSGGLGAEVRSQIYLTAARIFLDKQEISNEFYKYLCRSFTSKGDNAIQIGSHIDCVKNYYLTGLRAYELVFLEERESKKPEIADAAYALCRYLYSFLGRENIPFTDINIKDTINDVYSRSRDKNFFFKSLLLLFSRSQKYSMNRVLVILFENQELKKASCNFLNILMDTTQEKFAESWKKQAKEIIKQENELLNQLAPLHNFQISEIWLLSNIERIKNVTEKVLFDIDKDYLNNLQSILDNCISLTNASDFDEKNNKIEDIKVRVEYLLQQVQKNPTKLAIEDIYPIIKNLLVALNTFLDELYQTAKPELLLSSEFSYQVRDNHFVDIEIKVQNNAEGHAEQVELAIENDSLYYILVPKQNNTYGTIRGKSVKSELFTLELTPKAILEQAFTLKAKAKFIIRQEQYETPLQEVAIQLGNLEDFIEAENKYATYAESSEVKDESMFFGRKKMVDTIYEVVCNQYKSFVFYGQKRAGKSSILHHLEQKLLINSDILVANIGNIGGLIDENTKTSLLYQILYGILQQISFKIEDKELQGFSALQVNIPSDLDFYNHPSPLQLFKTTFQEIKRKMMRLEEWKNVRIVVLIDEFTYIYHLIVTKKLSIDFMINWKAILQENYFSVVLVAQDFYPKFKALDSNAFQTMQLERVSYLEKEFAMALIDEPIKLNGNSRYTSAGIERVYNLTAGSPFYIQIFCNKLVEYVNRKRVMKISDANVNQVLKDAMMKLDKGVFDNLINDGDTSEDAIKKEDSETVLREIAKLTENQEWVRKEQIICEIQKPIHEILENLVVREVVDKNNDLYKLRVILFKEWLNKNSK